MVISRCITDGWVALVIVGAGTPPSGREMDVG